ncbi:MAG: type II toxin-antitoxin system RelE/ParE family toxin, partial [Solirubrobacteraceae bacterium]
LRPRGGHLRILFAFDPRRSAILLLGEDKSGQWSRWYETAIPEADRLYDEHLRQLRDEGALP